MDGANGLKVSSMTEDSSNYDITKSSYDENNNLTEKVMRAAAAIMPAQNCVGTTVGHANYVLIANLVQEDQWR